MKNTHRFLLLQRASRMGAALAILAGNGALTAGPEGFVEPVAPGPFKPGWDSMKQYRAPDWFRDAKFGIWAHWTAQCVPEQGDWYAWHMYRQYDKDKQTGRRIPSPHYDYHLENYGHPSEFGFKDINHLWNAGRWEPEKLISLFKQAGAKYFVAMANHHDNLDCYDSKYQPWNTVNVGPRKDLVGIWEKAAREAGLRFGASVHAARVWDWFEVAHGADIDGPMAGVPYDGRLTKADGKGKWWEGLDPADLYGPHGAARTPEAQAAMNLKFYNRTLDLINRYHPDLVYFDDSVLPLDGQPGNYGLKIAAHYYNSSIARNGGKLEAVMNTKVLNEEQRRYLVWDIERGFSPRIEPEPWQTCTCIGDWHYRKGVTYKSAATVIRMLCDIVSKNGNLLLSIPMRGDGSIDDEELRVLRELAAWMNVNGEAIFGSRPWHRFGEGKASSLDGNQKRMDFTEGQTDFDSNDIRYTLKGRTLYAIVLGWPEKSTISMSSLGSSSPEHPVEISSVRMLGSDEQIQFTRDASGLHLKPPAVKPDGFVNAACVFRIESER